jgi:hypothetical protein
MGDRAIWRHLAERVALGWALGFSLTCVMYLLTAVDLRTPSSSLNPRSLAILSIRSAICAGRCSPVLRLAVESEVEVAQCECERVSVN